MARVNVRYADRETHQNGNNIMGIEFQFEKVFLNIVLF